MTRLIPIVVLVSEESMPALLEATEDYRSDTPARVLADMDELVRRNGWSDEALVAGTILNYALAQR